MGMWPHQTTIFDFDPLSQQVETHSCATKKAPLDPAVYSSQRSQSCCYDIHMTHMTFIFAFWASHRHLCSASLAQAYVCSHCITRWLVQLPTWRQGLADRSGNPHEAFGLTFLWGNGSISHVKRQLGASAFPKCMHLVLFRKLISWHPRQNRKQNLIGGSTPLSASFMGRAQWSAGKAGSTQAQAFEGRALGPKSQFCYKMQPGLMQAKFLTHSKKHFDIAGLQ